MKTEDSGDEDFYVAENYKYSISDANMFCHNTANLRFAEVWKSLSDSEVEDRISFFHTKWLWTIHKSANSLLSLRL